MLRKGFTLVELLVAIVVAGIMLAIAIPRLQGVIIQEALRSSRREVATRLQQARSAAVQRGCQATLNLDAATARVWVTACKVNGVGLDTLNQIANLRTRYQVAMAASGNQVRFGPHGLAMEASPVALKFARSGHSDSLAISPVGRAMW